MKGLSPTRLPRAAGAAALAVAFVAAAAAAEEPARKRASDGATDARSVAGESTFLDFPPFPGLDLTDAIRGHVGSFIAPNADAKSGRVTLFRPELGLRATWPVNDRLVLRISSGASSSRYFFSGDPAGPRAVVGKNLELYATRISFEGAWRLGRPGWLRDDETWSLLGALSGRSRWEDGSFDDGLGAAGALGFGYEIPDRLRLALGVSLRSALGEGGIDPSPFLSLRWSATDRLTLRTHELGLRLEYDLTPWLEVHTTGSRSSDIFRLRDRSGINDDLTFRDRHLRFGTGVDWRVARWLRLDLELGALAERRIRVRGDDLGTITSRRVDPSIFVDVRLEIRL